MHRQGYSGPSYDRWVERDDNSTIHNIKKSYWTTKQAVIKKFGKKEDVHVVASDSELDTKLEIFKAIQRSCMELLRVIERYQDRLCILSQEENAMGRFLKSKSAHDKTRAGKMMAAVGKSQSFSAQQRLALRVPLVRLYQEVETFRYRAISDTLMTINRMEGARTEYRGALLWMKDVSEELDPDTYKQLEKFRKVQAQVRKTKDKFDKLKLDVMQKIDLLAASRCNMFSHVLATYQSTLLNFWSKTSRTMTAVAESFKGYQHYEFNMLKELQEPSKRLAEETSTEEVVEEENEDDENKDRLLSLDGDQDEDEETNFEAAFDKQQQELNSMKSQTQPDRTSFMDFGDEATNLLEGKSKDSSSKQSPPDLLTDRVALDDDDRDDIALLNDILNAPSGEDEFAQEWQNVFGTATSSTSNLQSDAMTPSDEFGTFMPSQLLDLNSRMGDMNLGQAPMMNMPMGQPGMPQQANPYQQQQVLQQQQQQRPMSSASKKEQKSDMSAWFNLFADLDPLSNPDAIGRRGNDMPDAM